MSVDARLRDLFLLPDSPSRSLSFPVSLEAVMVGKASFSDIIGPAPEEGVLPSSLQCPAAQRLSEFPGKYLLSFGRT